jgi:hypothetical protein
MALKPSSHSAQTFTLEGIVASFLLVLATFAIFQSSVILAPSWSELASVQLKQFAYDILRILDDSQGNTSLKKMIESLDVAHCYRTGESFTCNVSATDPEFSNRLNGLIRSIHAYGRLELLWVQGDKINVTVLEPFSNSPTPIAVRASRFVVLTEGFDEGSPFNTEYPPGSPAIF